MSSTTRSLTSADRDDRAQRIKSSSLAMPRADDDDDVAEDDDDDDERTFGSGAKATTDEKRTVKTRRMERMMVM